MTGTSQCSHTPVVCHHVCLPAKTASTASLSANIVPQSNVSLVESSFTHTALEGGGPERFGALTSHKQCYHLFICLDNTYSTCISDLWATLAWAASPPIWITVLLSTSKTRDGPGDVAVTAGNGAESESSWWTEREAWAPNLPTS